MKNDISRNNKFFRSVGIITIAAVYFLILVGGIVRSTGSGMGCPDWPKCFGQWIPPTDVSELPEDYKDVYAEKRRQKNTKLAKYLNYFGFQELANRITQDTSMYKEADFNAFKTWVEYLNRLLGAIIGLLVLATLVASVSYIRTDPLIFYGSLSVLIITLFQAWIGSIVVSTNLLQGMITLHMLLAVLIVFLLIYVVTRSRQVGARFTSVRNRQLLTFLLAGAILVSMMQIVLGTQVRENIDMVARNFEGLYREQWIGELGTSFYIHRSFSLFILALNIYILYLLRKNILPSQRLIYKSMNWLLACIIIAIASGAGMAYFAIPAFLQPIHLLLSVLIAGIQFFVILMLNQDLVFKNIELVSTSEDTLAYEG